MNKSIIFLDIETLPTNDSAVIAELKAGITAPGQFKKPESIQQWFAENGEKALQDAVRKTSFDGMYGRICCMAWTTWDGLINYTAGNKESSILKIFNDWVDQFAIDNANGQHLITLCGHNIYGFDLPFIKHRSIINKVMPSRHIEPLFNASKYSERIQDTMLLWSQDRDKQVSMNKLCSALGIEDDGGFDGSMVANAWETDPQKVMDHCILDVKRVREIYKRISFNFD